MDFSSKIGFPVILRPSFTLGGTGGGIAYNREELLELLSRDSTFRLFTRSCSKNLSSAGRNTSSR